MNPIQTADTNTVFTLPGGTEENNLPLNKTIRDGYNVNISTWQPSDDERAILADGGNVELMVYGIAHPPVSIIAVPAEREGA